MRLRQSSSLLLMVSLVTLECILPSQTSTSSLAQKLSRAHFEFSLSLYKQLLSENDDNANLVFSPYSVNTVLSMLFLGTSSASDSSSQLRSVLGYDNLSYVDVHRAFKEVISVFDDKYYEKKVRSANGLFIQDDIFVSPPYDRALREFYKAKVDHLDFRNADAEETMGVINDWVYDITDGQIPELLDSPPSKDAKMVLVNAMSMDARWLHPFDPNDTFDKGLFFLPGNER